jgi:hypothetical protein
MAGPNVIPLKSPQKTPCQVRRSARMARALNRQAGTAIGVGTVAVTLTALSLSHLARGVEIITASSSSEAWAMAVGIDLGFIALELSQLAISDKVRRQVSRVPFAGALVPLAAYHKDHRIWSVMIEVNRRLYMNEHSGLIKEGFEQVRTVIGRLIVTAAEAAVRDLRAG